MAKNMVSIIVLNYRTPEMSIDCVRSICESFDSENARIVVVDNDSQDGSYQQMQALVENIQKDNITIDVVQSGFNGGFSAGNNFGIDCFDADSYLLVNSDSIVLEGAIPRMLEALGSDKSIGIVGPEILSEDGSVSKSQFAFRQPATELLTSAQTGAITKLLNKFGVFEIAQESAGLPPDEKWLGFSCILIRREVFEEVGRLDDGFFMYYEDEDFCRRVRNGGWRLMREPLAKVVHLSRGYSDATGIRFPSYYYHSRSRYFAKHYGRLGLLMANIFWMSGFFIRISRYAIGKGKSFGAKYVFMDIWKGFWRPFRKRGCKG